MNMPKQVSWGKHLTFLSGLGVLGYIGETSGGQGVLHDMLVDTWAMLKTASPQLAMLLFILLIDERAERKLAQKECYDRTVDFITSTNLQTQTADKAATALSTLANGFATIASVLGLKLGRAERKRRKR